jgi:hypothetical protein
MGVKITWTEQDWPLVYEAPALQAVEPVSDAGRRKSRLGAPCVTTWTLPSVTLELNVNVCVCGALVSPTSVPLKLMLCAAGVISWLRPTPSA